MDGWMGFDDWLTKWGNCVVVEFGTGRSERGISGGQENGYGAGVGPVEVGVCQGPG